MPLLIDFGLVFSAVVLMIAGTADPFEVDKRGKYFIGISLIIFIIVIIDILFKSIN